MIWRRPPNAAATEHVVTTNADFIIDTAIVYIVVAIYTHQLKTGAK